MDVMAPSPITLQAVPRLSCARYNAIIRDTIAGLNPSILSSKPIAAITAPPGTPGAATMVIPNMKIKGRYVPIVADSPCKNITANEQLTNVIVLPDRWIFANNGIVKSAILSFIFNFFACVRVTGIVAADDWVPKAVKYAGDIVFNIPIGFCLLIEPATVYCKIRYTI